MSTKLNLIDQKVSRLASQMATASQPQPSQPPPANHGYAARASQ